MDKLPFGDNIFDLIWSEGAIYIMGFEKGIALWKRHLKPEGSWRFLILPGPLTAGPKNWSSSGKKSARKLIQFQLSWKYCKIRASKSSAIKLIANDRSEFETSKIFAR
jgi:hypothetical protein